VERTGVGQVRKSGARQRDAPQRKPSESNEAAEAPESLVGDAIAPGKADLLKRQAGKVCQASVGDGGFVNGQVGQRAESLDDGQAVVVDLIAAQPQGFQVL